MSVLSTLLLLVFFAGSSVQDKDHFEINDYDPTTGMFLVQGKEARLRYVSQKTVKLKAVFRPNTEVEVETVLSPAADGWITWTPKGAGLYQLVATWELVTTTNGVEKTEKKTQKKTISVRFAEGSYFGLVVMILAGIILFGGSYFSIRALLKAETE